MTLLTIVQAVAKNVGLAPPSSAQEDDPDNTKLVRFANEAGLELARRVDWTALTKRHQIDGTGEDVTYPLAGDHDRLIRGMSVAVGGAPVRGGLSSDEWHALTPSEGTPRYFRVIGRTMGFYPYPAAAQVVMVVYQSANWAEKDGELGASVLAADTDQALIPEELLIRGAVWRFLRHAGRDFADYLAEYEAMLADLAGFEGGVRQP